MDSNFWTSRLAAIKRQYNLHHQNQSSQHSDRLGLDDFEVEEDDPRPDFPCPYCYEDFDIGSLCVHLEDEHSCETRVTRRGMTMNWVALPGACHPCCRRMVCPVCSGKVVQDMLSHITLEHGHLFKLQRRHRLRKIAAPNSQALSLLGRDLREAHLQVLLGGGGGGYHSNSSSISSAVTDPFLSSFILNVPASEAEEISKSVASFTDEISMKNRAMTRTWKSSFDPAMSFEEREKWMRQAVGRAGFVQDLFLSTLVDD